VQQVRNLFENLYNSFRLAILPINSKKRGLIMLVKDLTTDQFKILIKETLNESQSKLVKEKITLTPDKMLNLAKEVYADLSSEDILEIESIALNNFNL
jgi:hypothetical protein